jgi:membrane protein DedA with SNARE-associated domain
VTIFLGAGYLFGNIQWVQDYLAVALAIAVAASAIPGFIIWAVHYLRRQRAKQAD